MYLKGSQWSMLKRKKRSNPWVIILLAALIIVVVLFDRMIRPYLPPLLIGYMTPTPTRSAESIVGEADALVNSAKYNQAIEAYRQAIVADPTNTIYY